MVRKLEKEFKGTGEVKGFDFKQLKRGEKALIYGVYGCNFRHFEVFRIKHTPICLEFKIRLYSKTESKEVYPKANDFGKWAFTTKNIHYAIAYFDELNK